MTKIYDHSDYMHVVARMIYKKTGDAYAYSDSAKTVKVDAVTLEDMFVKGVIVVEGDAQYKPVSLLVTAGVATVTYVKTDGTTATTAVLATLVSEEYDF